MRWNIWEAMGARKFILLGSSGHIAFKGVSMKSAFDLVY